jgi:hypothetical protein
MIKTVIPNEGVASAAAAAACHPGRARREIPTRAEIRAFRWQRRYRFIL